MLYSREDALKTSLNCALINFFSLPKRNYYAALTVENILALKSVLSDINNILTLRLSLAFASWICDYFNLPSEACQKIHDSINQCEPNSNGYDIDIESPVNIIAEVKCNIPINDGNKYGAQQRNGIMKDLQGLMSGKNKALFRINALKFLALYDSDQVREATEELVRNLNQELGRKVQFIKDIDFSDLNKDNIYVIYLKIE